MVPALMALTFLGPKSQAQHRSMGAGSHAERCLSPQSWRAVTWWICGVLFQEA